MDSAADYYNIVRVSDGFEAKNPDLTRSKPEVDIFRTFFLIFSLESLPFRVERGVYLSTILG